MINNSLGVIQRIPRRYPSNYADWTGLEYLAIFRSLLALRISRGPDIGVLNSRLSEVYAPAKVFLLNFAHHGIGASLSWFHHARPDKTEVILPAYICPSVPDAVRAVGLSARYVPVGDDLNINIESVRGAIGPSTLAVIAPHMYGCPAAIDVLEDFCHEADVYLIDDAAQVVGERLGGRLLGTFGDVGVVSFAQSKSVVTGIGGSGGVLLVNKPEWLPFAEELNRKLCPAQNRLSSLLDFVWNYMFESYTGMTGYYFGRLVERVGVHPVDRGGLSRIGNIEASIAMVQLDRLEEIRRERVRVLALYSEYLADLCNLSLPQYKPGRYLTRAMICLPETVDAAGVKKYLADAGVGVRTPYPVVSDINYDDLGVSGRRGLMGLPTSSDLNAEDVRSICCAVRVGMNLNAL